MIDNPIIDELILKMSERCNTTLLLSPSEIPLEDKREPYILFLGNGCSTAAGAPSRVQLAKMVLDLVSTEKYYAHLTLPTNADEDLLLKTFYKLTDSMSSGQVFRMLQSYYANIPVPIFYQQLAVLIKSGYFTKILTTNFDTLLEQACNGAGLQLGYEYEVITPNSNENNDDYLSQNSTDPEKEIAQIIKLHGDINQEKLNIAPWRINDILISRRRDLKTELKGDMIMIGYEFESPTVEDWIKNTSNLRDELWWVNSTPITDKIGINSWAKNISVIPDDLSSPEIFFNQLSLRLVRLPVLNSLNITNQYSQALSEIIEPVNLNENVINNQQIIQIQSIQGVANIISTEDLLGEDLRGNIRQAQSVLNSLEQSVSPGNTPTNTQHQINYQKLQISNLEDQLRNLTASRTRIRFLLNKIISDVKSKTPPDEQSVTLDYLNKQKRIIEKEHRKEKPNQNLISAAITAIALLVEKLNIHNEYRILDISESQELLTFVPNIIKKGGV